ncbi:centromere-associated protein E isoform X4 [Hypomesus transpacificus]|uniref:centromere-associated protein E isoform X4 n=1 Tax=Hypomesus transpacificus TaxID=137520 RepID=UPI001F088390|nr:centromere-associated protein E isoform X4 [Hypomesus transpacificus]
MTEESAVKVCVRVRPLIEREEESTDSTEPGQLFWKAEKHSIQQLDDGNLSKSFNFDRVFNSDETTDQLYQELAKPLVVSAVEGYNGTIFAYGQTSSGKTFTMMGSDLIPGVIPLAMEDVFQTIKNWPKKEFLLRVSYMEIYNETVTDLLCDSWKRKPLEIREGTNKTVYVADLTEELVTSPNQALAWIRKGEKNRHYGKTKMNQRSSRSHTIFRMIIESRESNDNSSGENADGAIIVSHLNLVDLAGTERASQTGAEGTRFKEGCNINRSLFTLGQVIKKLSDESQRGFTNYRDSKLTRILQNSLGGNAKTVIICTITPATIEETVSTLQFASAAKKMKNDPHVTEVSDEGALLKRYRNEIVDLKRRLNEVSSGTQTTESLSQLLQEKDQLQREQQDRIKNLTQLLVTSSNFVPLKKVPKRRETWGGKLLRSADPLDFNVGNVGSYVEPFFKKRKASMLTEQNEDGEDIDSRWYVPDESTFDMDMDQSCVTVRNHLENGSPQRVSELSDKVSCLEQLLETEIQQKREAMEKFQDMDMKMVDLVQQLETEIKQKQEAMEKFQDMDMKMVDLEQQLETEIKKKQEAMETFQDMDMKMVDLQQQLETEIKQKEEAMENLQGMDMKVVDLEKRLEENSQMATNDETQMKREFGDSLQLCETLMAEKAIKSSECDYLKLELGIFIEQTKCLEKDNSALHKELKARKEMDEFKSLEEECKKEYEKELQNEISTLKKTMATSELKCQELKASLETMSEQLKEKSDWAEELQSLSDKDLVQQVKQLRRSLDDAEGLSLDTKKEWAFLRSENISLKERDVTLTADVEKMRAEVNRLHHQLESEKSRFKKMQSDLQRELQGVFDENTKLTTLLDGKVPRNLIDSVELERTVSELKKELQACHEEERTLQAKLDDLAGLQDLPDKVDGLTKQVCDLTEKLCGVQAERDGLVSASAGRDEEILRLQESFQAGQEQLESLQADLSSAALRENSLDLQLSETNTQLENLRQELERSVAHNSQLLTVEESNLRLEESQRQRASVEEKLGEVQELVKVLEEKIADGESVSNREEHSGKTLEEQIKQLGEELESVREERDRLQSDMTDTPQNHSEELEELLSKVTSLTEERDRLQSDKTDTPQNHPEELEELLSKVTSLTEERDQLQEILEGVREERNQFKMDIQENVEMMIENQEELRAALERNREQQKRIKLLETTQSPLQKNLGSEDSRLEELQTHIRQLGEELESVREERDRLQSDKTDGAQNHSEELEELLSKVTSLTEERDRLQSEKTDGAQNHSEELEELLSKVTSLTEERDQLQEILEGVREERNQLKRDIEEMCVVTSSLNHHGEDNVKQQLSSDQQSQTSDNSSLLREQMKAISEELESVREERDRLQSEKTAGAQNHSEELEELISKVTSLTEERDQLQEILERVREERNQLEKELEQNIESVLQVHAELKQQQHLNSELQTEREQREVQLQQQIKDLEEELATVQTEKSQLKTALQEKMEMASETQGLLSFLQEEHKQRGSVLEEKETVLRQQTKDLSEELDGFRAEQDRLQAKLEELLSKVTSITEERDQLQDILEGVREERNQLKRDLEEAEERMVKAQEDLKEQQDLHNEGEQREVQMKQQIEQLAEEQVSLREEKAELQRNQQDMVHMVLQVQSSLREQQHVREEEQAETKQQEAQFKLQLRKLEENIQALKEAELHLKSEAETSHQLLSEAKQTIQVLTEQIKSLEQSTSVAKAPGERLGLGESSQQLQDCLARFQRVLDVLSQAELAPLEEASVVENKLSLLVLPYVPKPTKKLYSSVFRSTEEAKLRLFETKSVLRGIAEEYRCGFEALVKQDLAVFEERRLQDVLLCRAQAACYSVGGGDLQRGWEQRLSQLNHNRGDYLQKMTRVLEKLEKNVSAYTDALTEQLRTWQLATEDLRAVCEIQPAAPAAVERYLQRELSLRSSAAQHRKTALQGLREEHRALLEELKQAEERAGARMRGERSKTFTLLQGLDKAPIQTEVELLKTNQQLAQQLEHSDTEIKVMQHRVVQLEDAQREVDNRVSTHQQTAQRLQAQLQDACAQVQEKEAANHTLRDRLRKTEVLVQAEGKQPPSATEMEMKTRLVNMEVEMTAVSTKHQDEILRMTTMLNHKEEALRKLRETLRKTQQEEEQSFVMEGKELHARLTTTRGRTLQSRVSQEKSKLEVEVSQLQQKIKELESLVSSQHIEISKWKDRALKLKGRRREVFDQSPSTPTRTRLPAMSEGLFLGSPKRGQDSAKPSILDSPKSKFFDARPGSEINFSHPHQFFDNSRLDTIPDGAADKKEEWWPLSPKQEETCKTQ